MKFWLILQNCLNDTYVFTLERSVKNAETQKFGIELLCYSIHFGPIRFQIVAVYCIHVQYA